MQRYWGTKIILFTIALVEFMGFTISVTLLPTMMTGYGVGSWGHSTSATMQLTLLGILLAMYPLGQFVSAPSLGALSDQWGRRKLLLITLVGGLFASLITSVAIQFNYLILLFVARLLSGLFAGNVTIAQASMIDISDSKTKSANISLIQLSLGMAWVFGGPLCSVLSNENLVYWFQLSIPYWFLTLAHCIIMIIFYFFYKETFHVKINKKRIKWLPNFRIKLPKHQISQYRYAFIVWSVFIIGWGFFLQFIPTFFILKMNFTVHNIGGMLAFMGGTFAATQLFLAQYVLRKIKPEKILFYLIYVPGAVAIGISFLYRGWLLYMLAFVYSCSIGLTLPSLLAFLSNQGGVEQQGQLMGVAQSIQSLMTIFVNIFGGLLLAISAYSTTVLGGFLMFSGAGIYCVYYCRYVKVKNPICIPLGANKC